MPNGQTLATAKWQAKAGYTNKNFKLKKDLVEEFVAACQEQGVSQASVISKFMRAYIDGTIKFDE